MLLISTIITFAIILGLLVFVHELGHFITARFFGVKVDEFGFGFPPRIFSYRKGETEYSFNWIPLGGFVKIKGEEGGNKEDKDSFSHKPIWQRIVIVSSGVIMNFVLAFVILSIGFIVGLPQALDNNIPDNAIISDRGLQVTGVLEGMPAMEKISLGDRVVSVDKKNIASISDFNEVVSEREGVSTEVTIERAGKVITQELVPVFSEEAQKVVVGLGLAEVGTVSYVWYEAFWQGAKTTVFLIKEIVVAFYDLIKRLIVSKEVAVDISGPVGIAVITGLVVKLGFIYILQFAAILSINLGIINFFPFPALDGGRAVFLIFEKIRGRPVEPKLENLIHNLGFISLMILIVLVTYRDIRQWGARILEVIAKSVGIN